MKKIFPLLIILVLAVSCGEKKKEKKSVETNQTGSQQAPTETPATTIDQNQTLSTVVSPSTTSGTTTTITQPVSTTVLKDEKIKADERKLETQAPAAKASASARVDGN